jgi:hypothetical protein
MPRFEHAQTGKGITASALPLIPNLQKTDTSFYWNIFLTITHLNFHLQLCHVPPLTPLNPRYC